MKTRLIFLLLLVFANGLPQPAATIRQVHSLNALSDRNKGTDPKLMRRYANEAFQLSKKINFKIGEGAALLNLGNASIIDGDYRRALNNFYFAQFVFENALKSEPTNTKEIKGGLAKAYGSAGIVFAEQSNYPKALQYHLKAVRIYEEIGDRIKCAQVYNNIGVSYKAQSEDSKALEYFLKAQNLQRAMKDPEVGITLTNIANCYLKQKTDDKALEYYNKAKAAIDKTRDFRALGEWHNNIGLYYKANHELSRAIESWIAAISAFMTIGDKFGIADTYLYLGRLYLEQDKLGDALSAAENVRRLSKELGILEQTAGAEQLLSDIYGRRHEDKTALMHYKLYSAAKDSLNNAESIRKCVESEMNFEFEKREALQKKEIEKRKLLLTEQSRRNRIELFFTILVVLLLAGTGFLVFNRMQLKRTLTLEKELAEYEQKALHLQMNPHFVFNCLGSISSFIVKNGKDSAIKYLAKFSKLMRLTLEYSKQSLIPIDKEIQGLQNYLELEQLRFNHKFDFTIVKDKAIEDDLAIPPLLLQPFVENAIIHGVIPGREQGRIAVEFKLESGSLLCTISDNGIGYNTSLAIKEKSASVHKSMALDLTKKRLSMIAASTSKTAQVTVEETHINQKIAGTKVTLLLPVQFTSNTTL